MASVNKPLTLDINDAKLYNKKDILFHGYIYPFAVLYSAWIGVPVRDILYLFNAFSKIQCIKTELVRENPTPRNVVVVIVPMLRSDHPETKEKIYYFIYQQLKYVFTGEKVESLQPTHFPIDLEFKHYFESKGIENQKDLNTVCAY